MHPGEGVLSCPRGQGFYFYQRLPVNTADLYQDLPGITTLELSRQPGSCSSERQGEKCRRHHGFGSIISYYFRAKHKQDCH